MKKMLLGLVLLCGMFSAASAQDYGDASQPIQYPSHLYLGINTGFGIISHSKGVSISGNNYFDPAKSNSLSAGLNIEYYLGQYHKSWDTSHLNWNARLSLKMYYSNLFTARTTVSGFSEKIIDENGYPAFTDQTYYSANFSSSFFNTELVLFQHLPIIDLFSFGAGLGLAFPLKGTILKRFEIVQPRGASFPKDANYEGFKFEEDGRVIVLERNDVAQINYYAKLGIRYDHYLHGRVIFLSPLIFYNFGISKATKTENFEINSLCFEVNFTIRF